MAQTAKPEAPARQEKAPPDPIQVIRTLRSEIRNFYDSTIARLDYIEARIRQERRGQ